MHINLELSFLGVEVLTTYKTQSLDERIQQKRKKNGNHIKGVKDWTRMKKMLLNPFFNIKSDMHTIWSIALH